MAEAVTRMGVFVVSFCLIKQEFIQRQMARKK